MANFAVAASAEVIEHGKKLLGEMAASPKENQGDTLARMFDIIEAHKDGEILKQSDIDTQALDASIANLRNLYVAAVSGKQEILARKTAEIEEIRSLKDKMESELRARISSAEEEKRLAVSSADAAAKEAAQAVKDAQAAKDRADTADSLAAEKDKTIAALAEKLAAAEAKAERYDRMKEEKEAADEQVRALKADLAAAAKDHEIALLRAVSDRDQEIAGLKTKVEMLQDRITELAGH